ncbi:MAG: sulfate adenylyltransferase subunit CysN [Lentisphaeria bacterium]
MSPESSAKSRIRELFAENERKDILRFLTAGSVDDGKSTLIGRLLFDSKTVYEDHLSALERDSAKGGSAGEDIDYALLLDGLKAEREQGITIDVAYRYFSTPRRKFIIADSPGHEQYTRNMVTGGSTANLAVILVDAKYGVLPQTKRHSFIASLLGIKHILVAVNKMDAVEYDESVFDRIKEQYSDFAARLDVQDLQFIPISALKGDNVVDKSDRMLWYEGPPLLRYLETVHVASDRNFIDLRFPVQYVIRPGEEFRGFAGTLASGVMRPGEEVVALPSGQKSRIKAIENYDGEIAEAFPPLPVCVTLEDEIDVSRGDMLAHAGNVPHIDRHLEAMVVWMSEDPMQVNGSYIVKQTTNSVPGTISNLRYKVDVNTLHRESAETLELNEIGRAAIALHRPICFDAYSHNNQTGCFVIIDRLTNATLGAGMILERETSESVSGKSETGQPVSEDIHAQISRIKRDERLERMEQQPATVWLTGLPKAGKSTIAYALERRLFDMNYYPHVLDGENLRLGVSRDLGFTGEDRSENIRRAVEVAKLCNDIGMITIAAFVSPYKGGREHARQVIGDEAFLEVYLNTPLEVCEQRDAEGLYERARAGEIKNFSGVTAPYEPPAESDIVITAENRDVDSCVDQILEALEQRGIIKRTK